MDKSQITVEHIHTGKRCVAVQETRRVAGYENIIWRVNGQVLPPNEFLAQYRQIIDTSEVQQCDAQSSSS